ncbi:MAG: spore coat protein GerQ [Bacilli bacterium]|nr:spore coat protein GerQ [Bacilli bacterium]
MNGNFYQNPTFPNNQTPSQNYQTPPGNLSVMDSDYNEQSYIENILRLNKGRKVKAYVSFPDSTEWKNSIFTGLIEEAGKDHLIIKDVTNGNWYLIRILYLDYVEFMEPINYLHAYSEKTF